MKKMSEKNIFYLDVDKIIPDPNQPRQTFDEEEVNSTALTLLSQGQINPVEVNGKNTLVTGEIRWRAVKKNVELYPDKPELRRVKCTRWSGTPEKRFERQVIENLHHNALVDIDRDKAVVKLWETGNYPNQASLGKSLGLNQKTISDILIASKFRVDAGGSVAATISNRAIMDTEGLEQETREKILTSLAEGKIKSQDIREVKKIAQASPELLKKALEGDISVERAVQAAETVTKIESRGVSLSGAQKQRLADQVAQDEKIIESYEEEVLAKVHKAMTTKPSTSSGSGISEPIGRLSPVNNIIAVKDEITDNFRRYIGNCDMKERTWAKKIMEEIRESIDELIELVNDD